MDFLPVSKEDMLLRDWYYYDFLICTGDAYVDHPSFGVAIISRLLEAAGYRAAVLAQPRFDSPADFEAMGRPRYGVLVTSGNVDSMVSNYSSAKNRRKNDFYSPAGRPGRRPDRAVTVYTQLAKRAFEGIPVVIGGLEASLRRFAHYDYWEDRVMPSILADSGADILSYGMGERSMLEVARHLKNGEGAGGLQEIRGICFFAEKEEDLTIEYTECPSLEEVREDKVKYAAASKIQYDEQDHIRGRAICQRHGGRALVQTRPSLPIDTAEFDRVYELPYTREPHPMYEAMGGVKSIEEVRFSIVHNRGCFGGCNFCSLAFHQGRAMSVRSHESILREAERLTKHPEFKGYIHDVGGPTANFRNASCKKQKKLGLCKDKRCLAPVACEQLIVDHSDYLKLLRKIRAIDGVKKVFIRSGIRFDYLVNDKNGEFFAELVKYHISGQLKVAPEHCSDSVLDYMGKPHFNIYRSFEKKYKELNERYGLKQYLVPYLISSHPGATLNDAIKVAEYLNLTGRHPEQVQDFYPTPGTLATAMYYTGIDPRDMKPVYVARGEREKAMQRALLQWKNPKNYNLVKSALTEAGREDLIGYAKGCLIPPRPHMKPYKKDKK
ncbi:MAG: YgiQ family radical SAM protein [Oscillospiraceae bacterium]|nr:YgiQ family radical SAM protein [Oscillospiraceae bacterium]